MDNPELNLENLFEIKSKVENNTATSKDYEKLDYFLSAVNMSGYILNNIKERGYGTYQSYINERNSLSLLTRKDNLSEGFILGIITECISILTNFLTSNN